MKFIFTAFFIALALRFLLADDFKVDFTIYHTSDQIDQELREIAKDCNGYMHHEIILKSPEIAMLTYTDPKNKDKEKIHAFFVFGEHARELVAVEAGLHLVRSLCGKVNTTLDQEFLKYIRENYEIKMVINANPAGRRLVEKGQVCLRMNDKGVDINRNWGDHWRKEQPDDKEYQTVPGSKPFSEVETQALKREIEKFKPKVFLDIHSGMKALLAPYAFKDAPVENIKEISSIFKQVNDKYCHCQAGSAVKLLHYESYGCAMDYVYDLVKVKYSFAWEIFGPPEEEVSRRQTHRLKRAKFMSKAMIRAYKQKSELAVMEDLKECFMFFNPVDKKTYSETVNTWAEAVLEVLNIIEKEEKRKASKSPKSSETEKKKPAEDSSNKSAEKGSQEAHNGKEEDIYKILKEYTPDKTKKKQESNE